MARAKAAGKRIGREKLPEDLRGRIRSSLEAGRGIVSTAREHGVGVLTVQRIKKEMIQ